MNINDGGGDDDDDDDDDDVHTFYNKLTITIQTKVHTADVLQCPIPLSATVLNSCLCIENPNDI